MQDHNIGMEIPFSVEYIGYFEDKEFDRREIQFSLGEGISHNVVEGIEIALRKFKKGEKSRITVLPKYGFREKGWPEKNIPPNATVIYEVTLKQFEKVRSISCSIDP